MFFFFFFVAQYDTLKSIFLSDPEKAANFWYKWAVSQTNTVLAQTLVYPYVAVLAVSWAPHELAGLSGWRGATCRAGVFMLPLTGTVVFPRWLCSWSLQL